MFTNKRAPTSPSNSSISASFTTSIDLEAQQKQTLEILKQQGFTCNVHHNKESDKGVAIVASKGTWQGKWHRLVYFLICSSIIMMCLPVLTEDNRWLKYLELTSFLLPSVPPLKTHAIDLEQTNINQLKINEKYWLDSDNLSFNGFISLPENHKTSIAFLPYQGAFLVQRLPFSLESTNIQVDYDKIDLLPNSFTSDLTLTVPELNSSVKTTLKANQPFYYQDYTLYSSAIGDGGTELNLIVHLLKSPVFHPSVNPIKLSSGIHRTEILDTPDGSFTIKFKDFQSHNNQPFIVFDVTNNTFNAQANTQELKTWEYKNHVLPILQSDRLFYKTGVRTMDSEPFQYLRIPADENETTSRFFHFLALLNHPGKLINIINAQYLKSEETSEKEHQLQRDFLKQLLILFRTGGYQAIEDFIMGNISVEHQADMTELYFEKIRFTLQTLYLEVLKHEKVIQNDDGFDALSEFNKNWFDDALQAISNLNQYGPPMYFEVKEFNQVLSTKLHIHKSISKDFIYLGISMFIAGLLLLFFIRQHGIHVWIEIKSTTHSKPNPKSITKVTITTANHKALSEIKSESERSSE